MYLEAYLGLEKRHSFVALSTKTAEAARGWHSKLTTQSWSEFLGCFWIVIGRIVTVILVSTPRYWLTDLGYI